MMFRIVANLWLFLYLTSVGHSQDGTLVAVDENGSRSEMLNVVFLSEGYTDTEMDKYADDVTNVLDYLFEREPWKQYRSCFNIYRIEVASNESGTDNGIDGSSKDTYFNSGFSTPSITQLLTLNSGGGSLAYSLLNQHVPEYDIPVCLVNDPTYGGSGGPISVASTHGSSAKLVEHEVGHSFAGLADEYDTFYAAFTPTESYNATQITDRNAVRWRSWIEESTPIPTAEIPENADVVGLFEGAIYRTEDWYRPHENSVMRNLGQPVGSVNREKFVLSYYEKISPIADHSPASLSSEATPSQSLSFTVQGKDPTAGSPFDIQWKVNGTEQTEATAGEFVVSSAELGIGSHTITAAVEDPTLFVRDDPSELLKESITWTVTVKLPATLEAWRTAYGADDANPSGDGLSNLLKYALGIDPNIPAPPNQTPFSSWTALFSSERYLTMEVPRTLRRSDIVYQVQSSPDHDDWRSGAGHTVMIEDSPTMLKVRDAVSQSDAPSRRFLRLFVRESD